MRCALILALLLNPIEQLDWSVQHAVQGHRAPALEPLMRGATSIGKPANVLGALLGIAILDVAAGPATARLAVLALIPTNLVVEVTKRAVDRARPDGEHRRSNASFPSSHAANAFALAAVLARRWRRAGWAFWTAALLVAASRVYLNRHFMSDVVAAAVIGVLCAALAARVLGWRPGPPQRGSPTD
jgi:undecaprenyl-diphosphatase